MLLSHFASSPISAQQKYWVSFRDKGPETSHFSDTSSLFNDASQLISNKALARRGVAKSARGLRGLITIEDAPVFRGYLDSLRSLGATVYKTSRWANAASVSVNPATLALLRKTDFVTSVQEVLRGSTASV